MKALLLILCSLAVFPIAGRALAIDPGFAKGSIQIRGTTLKLTHAYAFSDQKGVRILIADREMPKRVLPGIEFLAVAELARGDNVRGLFIRFDPQGQYRTEVTLLHPVVHGRSSGVVRNVVIANNRLTGEVESGRPEVLPNVEYRVTFGAPVFSKTPR